MKPNERRFRRSVLLALMVAGCWGAGPMLQAGDAQALFIQLCAPCHGKDGKARTPAARKLGVKDLTQSKTTDAEIQQQILEGKRDKRGSLKMPSFKGKLSEEDVQALIAHVKGLRK